MAEIFPWQKWLISYLWEQFLVPDHRIPIWLGSIWRLQQWNTNGTHQIHWNSFGFIDILKYPMNHKLQSCHTCTRTEPTLQSTTRHGTSQLWHVYENEADSSNLKISWIHENLIFITRIAPWDAMDFPWQQRIVNIRLDVWQKAAREHALASMDVGRGGLTTVNFFQKTA